MSGVDIHWHRSGDLPSWNEPNLSTTEAQIQHFVPRMFLKFFTGTDGLLRVFDLESNNEFRTSLGNAAVERGFNDILVDDRILSTETWLSELEGTTSPILEGLINDPDHLTSLSEEEEMALARFIAALRFRTPHFRAENEAMMASHASQIRDIVRSGIFYQYDEQDSREQPAITRINIIMPPGAEPPADQIVESSYRELPPSPELAEGTLDV